jgi:hypothetical protein
LVDLLGVKTISNGGYLDDGERMTYVRPWLAAVLHLISGKWNGKVAAVCNEIKLVKTLALHTFDARASLPTERDQQLVRTPELGKDVNQALLAADVPAELGVANAHLVVETASVRGSKVRNARTMLT